MSTAEKDHFDAHPGRPGCACDELSRPELVLSSANNRPDTPRFVELGGRLATPGISTQGLSVGLPIRQSTINR